MKRLIILLSVVAGISLVSAGAQANPPAKKKAAAHTYEAPARAEPSGGDLTHHRMSGCGLGSLVIQDSSKWMQVLAATLNGTAGSQTFGITSGTSNCTEDGLMQASREKEAFIEANNSDLRRDIAVGNGEYLASLASLYGCKGEAAVNFGKLVHAHNAELMQADPAATLQRIDGIMSQDASLKSACGA